MIDPVTADPKHYSVEFENDKVRVLRVNYGPGEKSVMHSHPDTVAVFLSDATAKFTYPDGKSEDADVKAGEAAWFPPHDHLPESKHDPVHAILVELK